MDERIDRGRTPFLRSPWGIAAAVLGTVAAISFLSEHRVHALEALPFLIVLACPLMHLFMHRDHGSHCGAAGHEGHGRHEAPDEPGGHGDRPDPSRRPEPPAAQATEPLTLGDSVTQTGSTRPNAGAQIGAQSGASEESAPPRDYQTPGGGPARSAD